MPSDSRSISIAERHFRTFGWQMFRICPPFRIVSIKGQTRVIPTKSGYPDFMGMNDSCHAIVCEVKESSEDTMPCSRMRGSKKSGKPNAGSQRSFMEEWNGRKYVGILWLKGQPEFSMYHFKPKGSYKRYEDRFEPRVPHLRPDF